MARAALVGASGSPAASPPTGSTSTWATSSPDELAADPLFQKVTAADDATDLLHDFGRSVDSRLGGEHRRPYQWSFALDLGRTRLVMLDNRCNRVLTPGAPGDAAGRRVGLVRRPGPRRLRPPGGRLVAAVADAARHPPPGGVERAHRRLAAARGWRRSPRRCGGPSTWSTGRRSAAPSTALGELFRRLGEGGGGAPGHRVGAGGAYAGARHRSACSPATCTTRTWPGPTSAPAMRTPVMQLTCSPMHNQVPAVHAPADAFQLVAGGRPGGARPGPHGRRDAARAWTWKRLAGPYFGNAVSTLRLTGAHRHRHRSRAPTPTAASSRWPR